MKFSLPFFLLFVLLMATTQALCQRPSFRDSTAMTQKTATEYFDLYMKMDFDKMAPLMAESITFDDPTNRLVSGWNVISSKDSVLKFFRINYASILDFKPNMIRTFFSGNEALFELDLTFRIRRENGGEPITIAMPLISIISVSNGKVISHRDFGDYTVFLTQYNQQLRKTAK